MDNLKFNILKCSLGNKTKVTTYFSTVPNIPAMRFFRVSGRKRGDVSCKKKFSANLPTHAVYN